MMAGSGYTFNTSGGGVTSREGITTFRKDGQPIPCQVCVAPATAAWQGMQNQPMQFFCAEHWPLTQHCPCCSKRAQPS